MRHVLLPSAIATITRGMGHATAPARLVALACFTLRLPPGVLRAAVSAINLASVTAATDQHLNAAPTTQEKSRSRVIQLGPTWTKSTMGGILPPHSCTSTM
jgi:hypothetical protein